MSFRQMREEFACSTERHRHPFLFLEIETADAQLRIELGDFDRPTSGHEEGLAFFIGQPRLDLLGALDGIALRIRELRELKRAIEALAIAETAAQGFLELGSERCGMFR